MKTDTELVFRVVSGSRAYGTVDEESDRDIREVVMNTPEQLLGLERFETAQQDGDVDVVTHSLSKFFRLLIKGNFNVHEWLWVPEDCVLCSTSFGQKLRQDAGCFLHDGIGRAILGYLNGQIRLMQRGQVSTRDLGEKRKKLIKKYGYDTKAAYHAYRLAVTGEILYRTAELKPRLGAGHIDVTLAMKRGKYSFMKALNIIENAVFNMEEAREENMAGLPKKPPYALLNEILIAENLKLVKEHEYDKEVLRCLRG